MKKIFVALGLALIAMNICNVLNAVYLCTFVAFVTVGVIAAYRQDKYEQRRRQRS